MIKKLDYYSIKALFCQRFMANFKKFFTNIKDNWNDNKTAKLAKLLSFVTGLVFGLIGIILVVVWKYIFSSKDELNKYCIRLSVVGAIARVIVFTKICAVNMFGFGFPFGSEFRNPFPPKYNHFMHHVHDDDFFDTSFREIEKDMHRALRQQEKAFEYLSQGLDKQFNELERQRSMHKKAGNIGGEVKRTEKVSLDKDGVKKTTIEETGPNSFRKIVIKEKFFDDKSGKEVRNEKNQKDKRPFNKNKEERKHKSKNK